jgi:hypothetical protein
MAARTFSRLAPAFSNLRAGASLAQRRGAFRSLATEAGSTSVSVSSRLLYRISLFFPFTDDGSRGVKHGYGGRDAP